MVNFAGVAALGSALVRPGLLVPHVVVPSIAQLNWARAKQDYGITHVILDKDNCITAPYSDNLAEPLYASYKELISVFGVENVVIVSNSVGSSKDVGAAGARHLSRMLGGTTVLCHKAKKPARACARQVVEYLQRSGQQGVATAPSSRFPWFRFLRGSSRVDRSPDVEQSQGLKNPIRVLVIGDRITTDTVLAHRISDILSRKAPGLSWPFKARTTDEASSTPFATTDESKTARAVAVLTTHLWAREGLGNMAMRKMEERTRNLLLKRGIQPGGSWEQQVSAAQQPTPEWEGLIVRSSSTGSANAASSWWQTAVQPTANGPTRNPTISSYLSSRVRTSSFLPSWAAGTLSFLITNRLTAALISLTKDGWYLILQGVREGLNRPDLVFDSRSEAGKRNAAEEEAAQKAGWEMRNTASGAGKSSRLARSRSSALAFLNRSQRFQQEGRRDLFGQNASSPFSTSKQSPSLSRSAPEAPPMTPEEAEEDARDREAYAQKQKRIGRYFFAASWFTCLVVMPVCWWGGGILHDYMQDPESEASEEAKLAQLEKELEVTLTPAEIEARHQALVQAELAKTPAARKQEENMRNVRKEEIQRELNQLQRKLIKIKEEEKVQLQKEKEARAKAEAEAAAAAAKAK